MTLSIYRIHENKLQPRKDLGDVSSLAESIRENGLLQRITVTPCECKMIEGPHFRILDGHRRHRAMLVLHHLTLSDSEYKVYENLSPEQEVALVQDVNIERQQYSPVEIYNALEMRKRYGALKESAHGRSYNSLKKLHSAMGRLAPELREKVVWGRGSAGGITVRMARDLAEVHNHSYQVALASAGLSTAQLRAAIALIKEKPGVTTVDEAIRRAKLDGLKASTEDKVSAAAVAMGVAIVGGAVRTDNLVHLGFSARTAERTLKKLESGSILRGGRVDPDMLKFLRGMAAAQKDRAEFLRRLFEGDGR